MNKNRINYVRKVLIKNGVKLAEIFRHDRCYWVLRDSNYKFRKFKDEEIHVAIILTK